MIYTRQDFGADEMALRVLRWCDARGIDMREFWLWASAYVIDNPAATATQLKTAFTAWTATSGNTLDFDRGLAKLKAAYFPNATNAQLLSAIRAKTKLAWQGVGQTVTLTEHTEFVECRTTGMVIEDNGNGYDLLNCETLI
jgi:hypothetical protein